MRARRRFLESRGNLVRALFRTAHGAAHMHARYTPPVVLQPSQDRLLFMAGEYYPKWLLSAYVRTPNLHLPAVSIP